MVTGLRMLYCKHRSTSVEHGGREGLWFWGCRVLALGAVRSRALGFSSGVGGCRALKIWGL